MHFDNPLFILLILIAGLLRWLAQRATAKKEQNSEPSTSTSPARNAPIPRGAEDTEEARVRRFLEALGQPTSSSPPSKIKPRPVAQKRAALPHVPPFASPLPPLTTMPQPLPDRPVLVQESTSPRSAPRVFKPRAPEPPIFEIRDLLSQNRPASDKRVLRGSNVSPTILESETRHDETFLARLTTSQGLREAVILREIFGPPRSMQSSEERGFF